MSQHSKLKNGRKGISSSAQPKQSSTQCPTPSSHRLQRWPIQQSRVQQSGALFALNDWVTTPPRGSRSKTPLQQLKVLHSTATVPHNFKHSRCHQHHLHIPHNVTKWRAILSKVFYRFYCYYIWVCRSRKIEYDRDYQKHKERVQELKGFVEKPL